MALPNRSHLHGLAAPTPTVVGPPYPKWTYNALGGIPEVTHSGMFLASRTITGTFVDLLTDPDRLAGAQAEFEERTGGGISGDD